MNRIASLAAAIDSLKQSTATIGALMNKQPEDWRKAYLASRRRAQDHVVDISRCAEACFEHGELREYEQELRHNLNQLRAMMALHQANWPVVSIDVSNPVYRESLASVISVHAAFNDVIARMEKAGAFAA